jgi:hypothetical protein
MIRWLSAREGVEIRVVSKTSIKTYLVVGGAERRGANVAALEAAGIPCDAATPEEVLLLEPLSTCGLDGWRARFRDNRDRHFTGVVLVSPPRRLPWLDPGLFDWESGRAGLVAGVLAPGLANLYVLGLGTAGFRAGGAELLVALIGTQTGLDHPLVDELIRVVGPSHEVPAGRASRRLERRLQRRLRPAGARSWWQAARDLDGPLTAARGT